MKKIFLLSLIAVACIFTISSCKKENKAPVITLNEPSENDTYTGGLEEVHMEGTATDDEGLHSGFLSIIRTSDSAVMYSYELPDVHDSKSYAFHQHFATDSVSAATPMKVYIKFEDHEEALTTKVINITVNP